jgi:flagellar basal body-associated protein FliL
MSDANEKSKGKEKHSSFGVIINLVLKILIALVLATTVITNLFLVYIVVAPDTLPKPFYLQYKGDSSVTNISPDAQNTGQQNDAAAPVVPENTQVLTIQPGQGIFIDSGTKIVNLADQGGRKFIRVNVVVEFAPKNLEYLTMEEELKTEYLTTFTSEIDTKLPIINDTIISLVSTKEFAAIYTAEGKDQLRLELISALAEKLPEYTVLNVYFTEFVMQ